MAVLLLVIAGVHLDLYFGQGYRAIPTIGWLFMLTSITSVVLAIAVVVAGRWVLDVSAGLFALGVLGGYVLTLVLPQGLFLFTEPGISLSGAISIAAEGLVAILSGALMVQWWRSEASPW